MALAAGCGGGDGGASLDDDERFAVGQFSLASFSACTTSLDVPAEAGQSAPELADAALAVLRAKPEAVVIDETGEIVREVMAAAARRVEPCYPSVAAQVEDAAP